MSITSLKQVRTFEAAVVCLLLISLSLNVVLGRRLRGLDIRSSRLAFLQVGARLPAIEATDLNGETVRIAYPADRPTVIYTLSPSCGWCRRNVSNVKVLAAAAAGKYRFVGLSLSKDGLADYITNCDYPFPIYMSPSALVISAYKLSGTPHTIVVSPDGRVLKEWRGVYDGRIQGEIEAYFQAKLPGLLALNRWRFPVRGFEVEWQERFEATNRINGS